MRRSVLVPIAVFVAIVVAGIGAGVAASSVQPPVLPHSGQPDRSPPTPPSGTFRAIPATASPACGDLLTSDAVLTHDLHCPGDGLGILGNVTLNLAGHTISGRGSGTGISVFSGSSARITNGSIRTFSLGVWISSGPVTIENVSISYTGAGVTIYGDALTIRRSTIRYNGVGVTTPYGAVTVTITDTRVAENVGNGFETGDQNVLALFSGDTFQGNGGDGVYVSEGAGSFHNNVFNRNGGSGLYIIDDVFFVGNYHVGNNAADRNGDWGIAVNLTGGEPPPPIYDDGGNEAKLNGNPAQCLGVTCTSQ
jgi:hypothetical protein